MCVGVYMCGVCNVWVCVCVGFCKVWVCVCVGFVKSRCVNVCGCFGNICTCIYCVFYCLYCAFVLFLLCTFILICFVCTGVRTAANECLFNFS
jgi:hypothetical protein